MARVYTVDASVFLNAFNRFESGYETSREFLSRLRDAALPIVVPTLILPEVAGVVSRAQNSTGRAQAFARHLQRLPHLVLVPLDTVLAREAVNVAAQWQMRASDAVYAAVARRFGSILVSLDRQQRERVSPAVRGLSPDEALAELGGEHLT